MYLFSKHIPRGLDNWHIYSNQMVFWLKEITLLASREPPEPIAHLP